MKLKAPKMHKRGSSGGGSSNAAGITGGNPTPMDGSELPGRPKKREAKLPKASRNLLSESVVSSFERKVFVWDEQEKLVKFNPPGSDVLRMISAGTLENLVRIFNSSDSGSVVEELHSAAIGPGGQQKRLSPEQLRQIRAKGQFENDSVLHADQVHEWTLSRFLQTGNEYRSNLKFLSPWVSIIFYYAPRHLFYFDNTFNIAEGLFYSLWPLIWLPHALLGCPQYKYTEISNATVETITKKLLDIMKDCLSAEAAGLQRSTMEGLQHLTADAVSSIVRDITKRTYSADEFIMVVNDALSSASIRDSVKILTENDGRTDAILELMKLYALVEFAKNGFSAPKTPSREEIRKKYPLRSLSPQWFEWKLREVEETAESKFKNDFVDRLGEVIDQSKLTVAARSLYRDILKMSKDGTVGNVAYREVKLAQDKERTYERIRFDFFYWSKRQLRVVRREVKCSFSIYLPLVWGWYVWQVPLLMLWAWNNATVILVHEMWDGYFGLRGFFGFGKYDTYHVKGCYDGSTIEYKKQSSLGSGLGVVFNGAMKMRAAFEETPDTGIIPKGFSRIVNVITAYVIWLFLGSCVFLTCRILATIIVIILSLVGIVCAPVLAVIIGLLAYPLRLLISNGADDDFDDEWPMIHEKDTCYSHFPWPHWDSPRYYPLLSILGCILKRGIGQTILALLCLVAEPVVACCISLVSGLMYIVTWWHDNVMYWLVIKPRGRVPMSNSILAVRTRGPGIAAVNMQQITQDSALLLLHAHLEKYELRFYEKSMEKLLEAPAESFENFFHELNEQAQSAHLRVEPLSQLKSKVQENRQAKRALRQAVSQAEKGLVRVPPYIRRVAMTKDDLDSFLLRAEKLVERFVEIRMARWIDHLHSKSMAHETEAWKEYARAPSTHRLTMGLVQEIFGYEFMSPLDEHDLTMSIAVQHLDLGGYLNMMIEAAPPRHDIDKGVVVNKDRIAVTAVMNNLHYYPPRDVSERDVIARLTILPATGRVGKVKPLDNTDLLRVMMLLLKCPVVYPERLTFNTAAPEYQHEVIVAQPSQTIAEEIGLVALHQVPENVV